MTERPERPEHLFVVRMWREADAAPEDEWRGSVEHIGSRTRLYFAGLDTLRAFIQTQLTRLGARRP